MSMSEFSSGLRSSFPIAYARCGAMRRRSLRRLLLVATGWVVVAWIVVAGLVL